MKRWFKLLSFVASTLIALSMFAGCSTSAPAATTAPTSAPPAETAASESPAETEAATPAEYSYTKDTSPVDITVFFRSRWWAGVIDEGSGWEDSAVFKHIQEKTGVALHFQVPSANENEALGPMIASNSFPDMIAFGSLTNTYLQQMIDAGQIYSITDLANQYAPALLSTDLIEKESFEWYNDANGKMWFLPGWQNGTEAVQAYLDVNFAPTSGENILYVRKDILKAWGKTDFTNWAEFNDLIQFAHTNFPDVETFKMDVNDQLDGGTFGRHFVSAFGGHLSHTYPDVANQKIEYLLKDSHVVDYLKWLNSLYKQGVITDTMLSDTAEIRDQKVNAGSYAIINGSTFGASNTINTNITKNDGNTDRNYVPSSQVSYNDQNYFQAEMFYSKATSATVITKNCKTPDRAIRLLEYLRTDDGQTTGTLGVEGTSWELQGDKKVLKPEVASVMQSDLMKYVQTYKVLGSFTPFVRIKYWAMYCDDFLTPTGELREMNNGLLGPYLTDMWNYGFCNLRESVTGDDNLAIKAKIIELQANYTTKMIAAKTDDEFNGYLNSLLSEANTAGLATLEGIWTQEYLDNCKTMGITPWEKLYDVQPAFEGYKITRDWQ